MMTRKFKRTVWTSLAGGLLLGACAGKPVSLDDRDRSGAYDGVWVAEVGSPKARTVSMGGNWTLTCEWDPYEAYFVIDDGLVQLGKLESKTGVSGDGRFLYKIDAGPARQWNGTISGNPRFVQSFTAALADGQLTGTYRETITTFGTSGCTGKIHYRKYQESEA